MAITNIPKLIIRDSASNVPIYTSPPYIQPSLTPTCPIQNNEREITYFCIGTFKLNNEAVILAVFSDLGELLK
ncbi:hypothetical protein ACTHQT_22040 [Cytobacillus praedii]